MDIREGDVFTMPAAFTADDRGINGAVAELTTRADGTIIAQIRIPGPDAK